jgi:ribonuclease P protein component
MEPLLGALLPKRWAKRAVTRNTIKRQIFSVAEQFESHLSHFAYVVRMRCAMDRTRFMSASSKAMKVAVREELLALFTQAVTRIPAVRHA